MLHHRFQARLVVVLDGLPVEQEHGPPRLLTDIALKYGSVYYKAIIGNDIDYRTLFGNPCGGTLTNSGL